MYAQFLNFMQRYAKFFLALALSFPSILANLYAKGVQQYGVSNTHAWRLIPSLE